MTQPHISLAAEKIGSIIGISFTNSILMTWLVMGFLTVISLLVSKQIRVIPGNFQSLVEAIIDGLYQLFTSVVGTHDVARFFPLLATIFIFVTISNWSGLLPGVGTIGFFENRVTAQITGFIKNVRAFSEPVIEVEQISETPVKSEESQSVPAHEQKFIPLFRGPTADLNTTLALAIIAVVSVQYFGLRTLGISYLKKFFNFSDPIMFGVGLLEIVSEFSRILSFAFRLFGNIFAGEVLLTVIAFLMPLIVPLPFLGLELFVGIIQALVFSMLTAVFLNMATVRYEH